MEVLRLSLKRKHRICVVDETDKSLNPERSTPLSRRLGRQPLNEDCVALEKDVRCYLLEGQPDISQSHRPVLDSELAVDDRLLHRPADVDICDELSVSFLESRNECFKDAEV